MWSTLRTLAALGLLVGQVAATRNQVHDTTTHYATTTIHNTHFVDVTVYNTQTETVKRTVTECTTVTLHQTVTAIATTVVTVTNTNTDVVTVTNTATASTTVTATGTALTTITNTAVDSVTTTDTDSVTITTTDTEAATVTTTGTDSVTVTTTGTESVTITNTDTDTTTTTVPTTTSTTQTVFTTTYDPCPKSCSVSVETVNLYFWPTDRPYTYPTTFVDPSLSYTFTSPSVYMFIPSAQGINTLGQPAGPSTSRWMLPLNLYDVSTIAYGSQNITRQLTLADLGTDCPKTADPTAIATMIDSRCNPILAAPKQVSSWAYPCNACGRFGIFDPPYAAPTLTGALVIGPTTTIVTTVSAGPVSTPTVPIPAPTTPTVSVPPVVTQTSVSSTLPTEGTTSQAASTSSVVTAAAGRYSAMGWIGLWSVGLGLVLCSC